MESSRNKDDSRMIMPVRSVLQENGMNDSSEKVLTRITKGILR